MVTELTSRAVLEAKAAAVSEAISRLWRPDAEKIIDGIVAGNEMMVVEGRSGSGKSVNLLPNLLAVAAHRGYSAIGIDFQTISDVSLLAGRIDDQISPGVTMGVAVLDEPIIGRGEVSGVIDLFHAKGFSALISMFRVESAAEKETADFWLNAVVSRGGKTGRYELLPKELPVNLAGDFIRTFEGIPDAVVNYILDSFPRYARVLDHIAGGKSIAEVNQLWLEMASSIKAGWGFNEEEAEKVNKRVGL